MSWLEQLQTRRNTRTYYLPGHFPGQVSLPQTPHWSWYETTLNQNLVPDIYGNIPQA